MPMPDQFADRLALPPIGAPMFIASYPKRVITQCKVGGLRAPPSLNARTTAMLDGWPARARAGAMAQSSALS